MGFIERGVSSVRYAVRSLRRNPGFAATVLLTLGAGVGANAAIFNLLHAVLLQSLPVPDAEQLRLVSVVTNGKVDEPILSYPILVEMQQAAGNKAALAGYSAIAKVRCGLGQHESEQAGVQLVTGEFFRVLGVRAQAGRLLTPQDDRASGMYAAVISGAYWSRRFGRDGGVIGRAINLNDTPVTIVGVSADSFFGMSPGSQPDYWLSVSAQQALRYQRNFWNSNGDSEKPFMKQPEIRWLSVVARVRDHRTEAGITAALNQIQKRDMQREVKGWNDPVQVRVLLNSRVRLDDGEKGLSDLRNKFAAPLVVLMCAALLVLLIACVNLASLSLARVAARRREIAVRYSIGASRATVMGHFAAETLLLSVAGGVLAIPVAFAASQMLLRWASNGNTMPLDVGMGVPVLFFTGLSALLAGAVFGLAPALQALHISLSEVMKAQASSIKGMGLPWGRTLIAVEMAFSFILLTGAVLFVRTLLNYADLALGYAPEHVLSVQVDPTGAHLATDQLLPIYHRVLAGVGELPGVRSVAFAECGLAEGCKSVSGVQIAGRPPQDRRMQGNYVTPDYFATTGMHLLSGRIFDLHDVSKTPVLAVVNETAARLYFGDVNPIGKHFGYGGNVNRFEIVGVIRDARVNDVHEAPSPMAFYSLEQAPQYVRSLEVRMQGDSGHMEGAVRKAIRQAAPELPVMRVSLLTDQVGSNLIRERLMARLASAFAVLALALACLGVYGVLSYATGRRTAEIGIRLALGARGSSVCWMILREAAAVVGIGLLVGVPIALAGMKLVQGLLYGVSAGDPLGLILGALSLLLIGCGSAFIPAWRASRVDPNVALRYE